METKTTKIILNDNVFSSIDKIHPVAGDVLIFTIKTDSDGDLLTPIDRIDAAVHSIQEAITDTSITVLFIPDTIFFEKCDNAEAAIHNLENIIHFLKNKKG